MKKHNKGYISLIGIIILLIISILLLFITSDLILNRNLIDDKSKKNYSYHEAENKLLLALYSDNYRDEINANLLLNIKRKNFLKTNFLKLKEEDLYKDDLINLIDYRFKNKKNSNYRYPKELVFTLSSEIDDIKTSIKSDVKYINSLFLEENELNYKDKVKQIDILKEKINELSEDDVYITDSSFYRSSNDFSKNNEIKKINNKLIIVEDGNKENLNLNQIAIFYKKTNSKLIVQKKDLISNNIDLKGIIYVNGDIRIKSDFNFKGIMINDGEIIVDPGITFNCKGLIINKNNFDKYFKYDEGLVYDYGCYVPGFIKFEISTLKKY